MVGKGKPSRKGDCYVRAVSADTKATAASCKPRAAGCMRLVITQGKTASLSGEDGELLKDDSAGPMLEMMAGDLPLAICCAAATTT
jgi:hypothetical protein